MKAAPQSAAPARRGFEPNWPARLGWALLLLYVVYAGSRFGFTWERFAAGLEHGGRFLARMWPARGLIALCRSFHPIIVAILFVKALGFGALAGIMALIVASIGFISKLFAEAIEEISLKQVEAVRATGAGFMNVLIMGVQPQVLPRFIGFATYQLDSNLRNSTMVGIVGGGGIGATLFTAYQRFDFDFVLAILIVIVALIMAAEIVSGWARRVFQ